MKRHSAWFVSPMRDQSRAGGFSLIELMITLVIAVILATIAAPSFRTFVASQRVKTASFDLVAALTQVRSEAIKRNANVAVTAAAGGWNNGWTISTIIASVSTTLGSQSAYTNLTVAELNGALALTFNGDGRLLPGSAALGFTVSDSQSGSSVTPRCVSLSLSGQASSKVGSCS